MKKAVLLLLMVTIIAGCIYLKNADKDTVLYQVQMKQETQVSEAECTEETISETVTTEEGISEPEPEESTQEVSSQETNLQEESETEDAMPEVQITDVIYEKLTENEQQVYAEILDSLLQEQLF